MIPHNLPTPYEEIDALELDAELSGKVIIGAEPIKSGLEPSSDTVGVLIYYKDDNGQKTALQIDNSERAEGLNISRAPIASEELFEKVQYKPKGKKAHI